MVIDLILYFVYGAVKVLLSPILTANDVVLSSDITNAFTQARGFLHAVDFVVPYSTFLAVISAVIVIEAAIMLYKVIYWLIKRIPTQS